MIFNKRQLRKKIVHNICVISFMLPFSSFASDFINTSSIKMATHVVEIVKIKDGVYEMNSNIHLPNTSVKKGVIKTVSGCNIGNEPVAITFVAGKGKVPFMKSLTGLKICPVLEIKGKE